MLLYDYDEMTGELLDPCGRQARPDPEENPDAREDGRFLLPRLATFSRPPKLKKNVTAVWGFAKNRWTVVADYRKERYWDKRTKERIVFILAQVPDDSITDLEPPGQDPWIVFDEVSEAWIEDLEKLKEARLLDLEAEKERQLSGINPLDVQMAILKGDTAKQEEYREKYDRINSEYEIRIEALQKADDAASIKAVSMEPAG